MVLYTSEDLVLRDKVSHAVHPPIPKRQIETAELENLQQNILQFGTKEVTCHDILQFITIYSSSSHHTPVHPNILQFIPTHYSSS